MTLRVGDALPDLLLERPNGTVTSLRDDLRGEAALLVFLRHLG